MTDLAEELRHYDLQELRGAEFHRLVRLAHAEGLLFGLLQEAGIHWTYAPIGYQSTQAFRRWRRSVQIGFAHVLEKLSSRLAA